MYTVHTSRTAHTAAVPFQGFQFDGAMARCGADEGAMGQTRSPRGEKQPKNTKDRFFLLNKCFTEVSLVPDLIFFFFLGGGIFPRKQIVLPVTELMSHNDPNIATSMAS